MRQTLLFANPNIPGDIATALAAMAAAVGELANCAWKNRRRRCFGYRGRASTELGIGLTSPQTRGRGHSRKTRSSSSNISLLNCRYDRDTEEAPCSPAKTAWP